MCLIFQFNKLWHVKMHLKFAFADFSVSFSNFQSNFVTFSTHSIATLLSYCYKCIVQSGKTRFYNILEFMLNFRFWICQSVNNKGRKMSVTFILYSAKSSLSTGSSLSKNKIRWQAPSQTRTVEAWCRRGMERS